MSVRFCDEQDWGFGWVAPEPALLERCSHALVADGQVWLIDAVDFVGLDERIASLGTPAGVIQLMDRHARDSDELARRLGVPLHAVPESPVGPFRMLTLARSRLWHEVALWWQARRVLVCADALGTAAYYRAGGEPLAVHPVLRLLPPRSLGELEPSHVLCGHGEGVHGAAAAPAVREALATARRRLPAAWGGALRRSLRRSRSAGAR